MKELKPFEIAAVKRQFLNSLPTMKKIEALNEKIDKLQAEKETLVEFLKGGEQGIMRLTGGYMSTQLIKCTYEPMLNEDNSPKTDKDGRPLKKRVLTYIPVKEVTEEDTIQVIMPEHDNDFDKDSETLTKSEEIGENPFEGIE